MKKIFVCLFSLGLAFCLHAQSGNDPVIFEINGKKIFKSEFMREFLRSVGKDPKAAPTACTFEKRQALEEYVQLFVNYRTKLEDAYANGFDTMPSMLRELNGYRRELAAPYLIDSSALERIMREAYERNHYVLSAAHIFISMPINPKSADTLEAYNKAMSYYTRVKNGEDFFALAREASAIEAEKQGLEENDPRRNDDGRLGNFTVFDMVYPFENSAYQLEVGDISKPIRTRYGYHVIKLLHKVPFFGKSTFQHIWISDRNDNNASQKKIYQAYTQINSGESFESVCRNYSDDTRTAENGGLLSDMAIRQVPVEYVLPIATLKPGEVCQPFKSQFGWHIVKLVKRDSLPPYEEMVPFYRQKLSQDSRSNVPKEAFVEQCKAKYDFKDYTKMYEPAPKGKRGRPMASLDECLKALNRHVFTKEWRYNDTMVTDMRPLFSVGEKKYTAVDLLKYIEQHQKAEGSKEYDTYLNDRFKAFVNEKVYEYADEHLEISNPEFGELMNEYRNGLIIFSYNDANVWSRAVNDSVGLAQFYEDNVGNHSIDNEEDASYFMGECVDMKIFTIADSAWLKPDKALKIVEKGVKSATPYETIVRKLNKALKYDTVNVKYAAQIVEVERQSTLTKDKLRIGFHMLPYGHGYQIVRVDALLNPRPKTLVEARGFYINDYQNYLEQQLIQNLRKKYNVIIHQDVIDEIVY